MTQIDKLPASRGIGPSSRVRLLPTWWVWLLRSFVWSGPRPVRAWRPFRDGRWCAIQGGRRATARRLVCPVLLLRGPTNTPASPSGVCRPSNTASGKFHAESADDIAHDDAADVVPAGKYTGVAEEQAQNQRAEREQDAKEEPCAGRGGTVCASGPRLAGGRRPDGAAGGRRRGTREADALPGLGERLVSCSRWCRGRAGPVHLGASPTGSTPTADGRKAAKGGWSDTLIGAVAGTWRCLAPSARIPLASWFQRRAKLHAWPCRRSMYRELADADRDATTAHLRWCAW